MAEKTAVAILNGYFNKGQSNEKPLREFNEELKALSPEEKKELAEGVCAITGDTLKA